VTIPPPSSPPSSHPAQTPTGELLLSPLQQYLLLTSTDIDTLRLFRQQSTPSDLIISQFHRQSVSFRSLLTTNPGTWLNDEVINFYLSVLNHYDSTQKENTPIAHHHFFNSFSIILLLDEGSSNRYHYWNVMRWSRKVYGSNLFQLHQICFPCNISQSYWSSVIVNIQSSTITYYDSMRGNSDRYMNSILHYLQDDWLHTRGFEMPNLRQWTLKNERAVPLQDNSYDCGAFVCLFATCMALGCNMDFTQNDAPAMRLKLAHLIFSHRINSSFPQSDNIHSISQEAHLEPDQVITQEISQAQSLSPSTQNTQEDSSTPLTGYYTITKGIVQHKRKFIPTQRDHRKKRFKPNA
jgi:hypothetical protein